MTHEPIMPPPGTHLPEVLYLCENCLDSIEYPENLWWAPEPGCWCCERCHDDLDLAIVGVSLAKWIEVTRGRT